MEKINYHRHVGAYGVCRQGAQLLVIRKRGGPYNGRYDLPGGTIEPNETVAKAVVREFVEETGTQVTIAGSIGVKDFVVPWTRERFDHTHCHHIALFYEVEYEAGDINESPNIDDSAGAEWVHVDVLHADNSSPLVMEAKRWFETGQWDCRTAEYAEWVVKGSGTNS
jgi:ADP-ribose pyrophosphatase YjhB (NUDIX family)